MGFISILFSFFHEIIIGSSEIAGSRNVCVYYFDIVVVLVVFYFTLLLCNGL